MFDLLLHQNSSLLGIVPVSPLTPSLGLEKAEPSSPQCSVTNVQVHGEGGFGLFFRCYLCPPVQKQAEEAPGAQPGHPAVARGCSRQQDPSRRPCSVDKENPIHDITFCTTAAWIKEGFLVLETP